MTIFESAGLLQFLDDSKPAVYSSNYEIVDADSFPDGMPPFGLRMGEFKSYGEAILTVRFFYLVNSELGSYLITSRLRPTNNEQRICNGKVANPATNLLMVSLSKGLSWCKDLGLPDDKCVDAQVDPGFEFRLPNCQDPGVISAIADAAVDPVSFMNRQGPFSVGAGSAGGILIPRLDVDVLNDLASDVGLSVNHLQVSRMRKYMAAPPRHLLVQTQFTHSPAAWCSDDKI